ncbi:MAG: ATP-binding cassette domain-containing protein [Acetobacteraceae bacterium]|nr:ATP-binding cassette domain-containing protein [Acetobacteraceae bacterium]
MDEPVVLVKDLTKLYRLGTWPRPGHKVVRAVDGVSFEVAAGEAVGFIGPNGAGKSTTIKMLTGILFPTAGTVRVLGLVPWRQRSLLSRRIGCVFGQRSQLWYHLPPVETFRVLRSLYDIPRADFERRLKLLREAFQLEALLGTPVRKLSLGERMRCEITASLLHQPAILFLDEPTLGLDIVAKKTIRDLLREANKRDGVTLFLASHDTSDIERLCDRVLLINQGRVLFDGSLDRLFRDYVTRRVVDVHLEEPWEGDNLAGSAVQRKSAYHLRLEIGPGREALASLLAELAKRCRVRDVAVSDPPLEDVIYGLYRRPPEEGGAGGGERP